MFLHRVIDPTLHPGPWCWGDYRDEIKFKERDGERYLWKLKNRDEILGGE